MKLNTYNTNISFLYAFYKGDLVYSWGFFCAEKGCTYEGTLYNPDDVTIYILFFFGFLPSGINFTSSVCFFFVSNALKWKKDKCHMVLAWK